MRAPLITRLRTSCPNLSVPKGWARAGPIAGFPANSLILYGASTGAKRPTSSKTAISAPPNAPSGLARTIRKRRIGGDGRRGAVNASELAAWPGCCISVVLLVADARVEHAVDEIHDQVEQDHDGRR